MDKNVVSHLLVKGIFFLFLAWEEFPEVYLFL